MIFKKIGVLGTGDVGKALANACLALGAEVMMGSRSGDNPKAKEWLRTREGSASLGQFRDAVLFGDLVILATLGSATEEIIKSVGAKTFASKVLIDATNPLKFDERGPALFVGHNDSLGERIQRLVPEAKVVKAFNSVGNAHMYKPNFAGGPPDMFICGNDSEAKTQVSVLLKDFGWGVVDIGGIDGSRYLEPMCMVWVKHGILAGSWNHAFKLLRK